MDFKFKVGQEVVYNRGDVAERVGLSRVVNATVYKRDDVYGTPIYQIKWPPTGRASVKESELSLHFE